MSLEDGCFVFQHLVSRRTQFIVCTLTDNLVTWKLILFPYISIPCPRRNGSTLERKSSNPSFSSFSLLFLNAALWCCLWNPHSASDLSKSSSFKVPVELLLFPKAFPAHSKPELLPYLPSCSLDVYTALFALLFDNKIVNAFRITNIGYAALIFPWCLAYSRYPVSFRW